MARAGALTALAFLLAMAGATCASAATVLSCPDPHTIVASGETTGTSTKEAQSKASSQGAAWKSVHASEVSCKPSDPPCTLDLHVMLLAGRPEPHATSEWVVLAECKRSPAGGVSHFMAPPPTSSGAGSGTPPGAGSPPLVPEGKKPPLVDCVTCEQLQLELQDEQARLAAAEAEERALIGRIKAAQLTGGSTSGLEAQLAANANEQARFRAMIKVVENKLRQCPRTCQQPTNPWQPR